MTKQERATKKAHKLIDICADNGLDMTMVAGILECFADEDLELDYSFEVYSTAFSAYNMRHDKRGLHFAYTAATVTERTRRGR